MSSSIKVLHKINIPINTDTNEAILSAIKECAYRGIDVYFCNRGLSVVCGIRDAVIDIQFQTFNRFESVMQFINKEYLLEKIHETGLECQDIVFSVVYPSEEESKLIFTRSMEEMDFYILKRNDKIKSLSLRISDEVLQVIDGELWDKFIENNSYNNHTKLCVKMTDCLGRLLQIEIHQGALLSYEIIQPAIDRIVDAFGLSTDQVDFVLNALKKHWQYKDQLKFYANL